MLPGGILEKIICELCGSNDFTKDNDGLFVCDFCRTKYTPEQAQKLMAEGIVKVDRTDEIGKLLELAKTALSVQNFEESIARADAALEIDPSLVSAWVLKAKATGLSSTIESLRFREMCALFEKAVDLSSGEEEIRVSVESADFITETVSNFERNVASEAPVMKYFDSSPEMFSSWQRAFNLHQTERPLHCILSLAIVLVQAARQDQARRLLMARKVNGIYPNGPLAKKLALKYRDEIQPLIDETAEKLRKFEPEYATPKPKPLRV